MKRFLRYLPLIAIALAIVAFFGLGLHRHVSFDQLAAQRAQIDDFVTEHRLAALALYALAFVIGVAFCLPISAIFTMIGGYLFGIVTAMPLVLAAMTLGATITFLATRGGLAALARARAGSQLDRFEQGFRADAFNYLLALRLIPVTPFPVMTLVSALLGVRLRDFLPATLIGIAPVTVVLTSVGAGMRTALNAQLDIDPAAAAQRLLLSPQVLLPIAGLILLALAPVAYRRFVAKRA